MAIKMTYQKPADVSYTDMAIYIDDHIKDFALSDCKEPLEIEKIYSYLYHLVYMLACKGRFFNNIQEYDDFALEAAGHLYNRVTNRRQWIVKEGERPMEPIVSVLNFIKGAIRGLKVNYQADNYTQIFNPAISDVSILESDLKTNIRSDYYYGLSEALEEEFTKLPEVIVMVLQKSPYKRDKITCKNLFVSIMLTFLQSITLPAKAGEKARNKMDKQGTVGERQLIELYQKQKEEPAIVYHLSPSMADYVKLLTNQVKQIFGQRIMGTKGEFELDEDTVDNIMASTYEQVLNNQGDDENDNR